MISAIDFFVQQINAVFSSMSNFKIFGSLDFLTFIFSMIAIWMFISFVISLFKGQYQIDKARFTKSIDVKINPNKQKKPHTFIIKTIGPKGGN